MRSRFKSFVFILLICLYPAAGSLSAEVVIPDKPYNHVVDLAGIVNDDAETSLNRYLLELEQKTTVQVVVLTIDSLEGEPLEEFSIRTAHEKWKLGQKGKDNGVLLLVSVQDRKYRFEIGYGLEGILPDSLVGSIGREYLVPYFRKGDYSDGIFAGILAVSNIIAADANVEITGMPTLRARNNAQGARGEFRKPSLSSSVFGILFFIVLIYLFIRHPRLLLFLFMMNMMGGGRRGGWGGSGGFGGGGGGFGGSFGGGGGGGFGGGGASGGW